MKPRKLTYRKIISIGIFALLFIGLEGWYLWQESRYIQASEQALINLKYRPILFLGNSHMHFGLNDQIVGQCKNLAYPSELLLFTYAKIRLLKPKVAIIALNPQHLQKNNEDALKNGLLSEAQYCFLYKQLTPEEKQDIYAHTPFEQWTFFKTRSWLPFLGTRLASGKSSQLLGGFRAHTRESIIDNQVINQRIKTVFENYKYQESVLQKKYLKKIVHYCQGHNIRLVFLSFPLHPKFYQKIPKSVFEHFQGTLKQLQPIGQFTHWDYTKHFQNKPLFFYDADHLNTLGAKVFSQRMKQRIEKIKLTSIKKAP